MEEISIMISIIAFCLFIIMITFIVNTVNQITSNTKLEKLNQKLIDETITKIDTFKSEVSTIKNNIAIINDSEMKMINVINSINARLVKVENRTYKKKKVNATTTTTEEVGKDANE